MDIVVGTEREIGELTGRMAAVERTAERLERKLDGNTEKTDEILKRIAAMDGGWRVLLAIAGAAGVLGGIIVKLLPMGFHL